MSGSCEMCGNHTLECICNVRKSHIEEKVNHPTHYQGASLEVIDIIEDFELNFCLGNAVKYILRSGKKGNKYEDLRKAIWYLNREVEEEQYDR